MTVNLDNTLKTPLGRSLNQFAARIATSAIQLTGKSLPASVTEVVSSGIVKVKFEVTADPWTLPEITVPIEYPQYIRYPIKVGDKGLLIAADAKLGGLTGLGSGVANLTRPGNLSALSFVWLGSTDWDDAIDPDALQLMANVLIKDDELSFFGAATVAQQDISGALSAVTDPAAQAVLQSIVDALANYNLATDSTT